MLEHVEGRALNTMSCRRSPEASVGKHYNFQLKSCIEIVLLYMLIYVFKKKMKKKILQFPK